MLNSLFVDLRFQIASRDVGPSFLKVLVLGQGIGYQEYFEDCMSKIGLLTA